jgi:RNA polymerase sigma factor (sigma-70 family)
MGSAFAADMMTMRPALVRFAQRLCHDRERSEDLASEAIARGWKYRERFEPGSNLAAWLSFILRNLFLSEQRRKRWDGGSIEDLAGLVIPVGASQEHYMALVDLDRALALIPRDQADAIIAVALEGGYEEAAEASRMALGTIKSRVARGRAALVELTA